MIHGELFGKVLRVTTALTLVLAEFGKYLVDIRPLVNRSSRELVKNVFDSCVRPSVSSGGVESTHP